VTYSIVARDPETGELGVGVASRVLAVGALCPWAEPGVGAVATQSFVDLSYGTKSLAGLRQGASPAIVLEELTTADAGAATRQVAVVDAMGRVAVHDGTECISEAGHVLGEQFSCQANMMRHRGVPEAMADAFATTDGSLVVRILSALDAAEAAGGDFRGRQSSAMKIVAKDPTEGMNGLLIDLRVDDHPAPLSELRRLMELHARGGWFGEQ
jgi:uncharacterized Ntn-hydrolase superfamily protein